MTGTGSLRFSVVLNAVTSAFNQAINQARQNYDAATSSIERNAAEITAASNQASTSLNRINQSGNARTVIDSMRQATAEINALSNGANISAQQLSRVGTAGQRSLTELRAEVTRTRAELTALSTTNATPADIQSARNRLAELIREVRSAQQAYNQFQSAAQAAMQRAAQSTQAAEEAARRAGTTIYNALNIRTGGALRTEIAEITRQLQTFQANAGAPAAEVNRVTNAARARIAELRAELNGVPPPANAAAASIRGMGTSLLGLFGVTAGLIGVANGLRQIVETTADFETVNAQLTYATGSAEKAGEEFEFVKKTVKELGLDLLSSARGFTKLAAATKGTALEGQATRDVFLGVAQAAAAMGLSADETNGVFLALSQIAGKGKVSMEELRGQLGERLPPAMKIAADSMGVTVSELNKLVEAGLDSNEFLAAFGPALQKSFSKDASTNIDTLRGKMNLLRTEFKLFLNDLGTSGIGQGAASIFNDLTGAINKIRDSLKGIDSSAVDAVKSSFSQLYEAVNTTFGTLFSAISGVNDVLNSLFTLVTGTIGAFTGFETASDDISFLTRVLQGVSVILASLSDGIYAIRIGFTIVTATVQEFFSQVASGLSLLTFGEVSKSLTDLATQLDSAAQKTLGNAGKLAEDFRSKTVEAMDRAVEASESAATKSADAHVNQAQRSADAQESIGIAAQKAGTDLVAAAKSAVNELQYVGDKSKLIGLDLANSGSEGADGLKKIGDAAAASKTKLDIFTGPGGSALINMANSVNDVKKAFQDLAKDAGVQLPATARTVDLLGLSMGTVAAKSSETAAVIARELPAAISKLNATQLTEFKTAFIDGLNRAGASADYVQDRVLDLSTAITKSLGVDINASLTGLSQKFLEVTKSIQYLIDDFDNLKKSGVDTGKVLSDALQSALDKAKNPVEVQELIRLWKQLGAEGKVTGDQLVDGLQRANAKIDELKPGINSLAEAFKTFGLQTREEASKVADNYRQAFEKITDSGQATSSQLREAFKKYAEATIAANGGVVDGYLKAEAAAKGLEISVDETGKAIIETNDRATSSTDRLADGYTRVGDAAVSAAERANNAMEKQIAIREKANELAEREIELENKRRNVDAEGFKQNTAGNKIQQVTQTWLSTFNQLKDYGVAEDAARQIASEFFADDGSVRDLQNNKYKKSQYDSLSILVRNAAQEWIKTHNSDGEFIGDKLNPFGRLSPPQNPNQPSQQNDPQKDSGKTINVVFSLGDQKVPAKIDESDESSFLELLRKARSLT